MRISDWSSDVCSSDLVASTHLSVANHISWLDISIINACEPVRFVAKAEIRDWPLAGWLASAAGSFYLRRGKGDAPRLVDRLATRSEEHTSELQSLMRISYAVFCLKTKKKNSQCHTTTTHAYSTSKYQ